MYLLCFALIRCLLSLFRLYQPKLTTLVLIPMMRTYLGHKTFNETAYYLRLTADVFPAIRLKLERDYKDIIPEMEDFLYEAD